ncbi:MAG: NADH-quinone oxidoreductase subunit NuoG [Nitrospinota bacterium]
MVDLKLTFTLNGRTIKARKGESVLGAALQTGTHIPHFCYHKNLSVVGQCRACLVEILDAGNGKPIPKLQPSCAIPVAEGMVVDSESTRVKQACEGVFEFLLKNHPLDCPVCDQGGECPLQDQSMAYAKAISRTHELRRIYPQKMISPYIKPEMNRCVHCTRCIRFTQEIDGGGEFGWANRGDRTEVGVFGDLPMRSIVSGNVIDICPVGALTDNKYRFTARVWEMRHVEGPCTLCGVGCRQRVWSREDELKRVTAGENDAVNDSWICDVGRWGWSGVQGEGRIEGPMIREGGDLRPADWGEALALIARRLGEIGAQSGGGALAGLGGARSTNEGAYRFGAFVRSVLGSNNLDCRIHPRDVNQTEAQRAGLGAAGGFGSLEGLGRAKAILLVGSDPFEEHPIMALQVRKAHAAGGSVVSVHPRRIDLNLSGRMHHLNPVPGEEVRALTALAKTLLDAGAAPRGEGADAYRSAIEKADAGSLCRESAVDAGEIETAGRALRPAEGGIAVVVGPGLRDGEAAAEAINIARMLNAEILFASGASNLQGAIDMGVHPGLLPGGRPAGDDAAGQACADVWGRPVPDSSGLGTDAILAGAAEGGIKGLYLFECDPAAEHPDGDFARRGLAGAEFVVVHASHRNASLEYANVILPALTTYEEEGTVTNMERRVQRLRRAVKPPAGPGGREAWRVFGEIARCMNRPMKAQGVPAIQAEIRLLSGEYGQVFGKMPEAGIRLARIKEGAFRAVDHTPAETPPEGLRMILSPTLWLAGAYAASARHLADLPGAALRLSPPDAGRLGVEDGQEARIDLGGETVRLPVRVDSSLPVGVALAPEGYLGALGGAFLNRGGDGGARGAAIRVAIAEKEGAGD